MKNQEEEILVAPLHPPHPVECEAPNDQIKAENLIVSNLKYLALGTLFGIVLVKAEVISWYRIQEMFRLHSFHMYGVIGSAVVVGMINGGISRKKVSLGKCFWRPTLRIRLGPDRRMSRSNLRTNRERLLRRHGYASCRDSWNVDLRTFEREATPLTVL